MRYANFRSILFLGAFLAPFFCGAAPDTTLIGGVALGNEPEATATRLFVTKAGDRIVGTLQNPDQDPRTEYRLRTPDGKTVTIAAEDLKNSRRASDNEVEYVKRKAAAADTVEGQWELAEWCRLHHFISDRKTHLNRIIQLEPNHREARAALGYSFVHGKWMTQEEIQESRGYRRYKGRWYTEQQIESLQRAERKEKEEKQWYVKVKRYLGWLDGSKNEQAIQGFSEITDPAAVKALGGFLEDNNYSRAVKLLLIHTLVHIDKANPDDRSACLPLALCALEDPDEEVRLSCLDHLKTTKDPDVVDFFVGKLNVTLANRKYKKDANMMINRAALALGEMGDDSAVGPLIKVLITEHKEKVVVGNPGQTSATFSNRGGGMSAGSSTKIVTHRIKNNDVLDALKKLTGVSFNFDTAAWQSWHDRKTKLATPDTRRGN